MRILKAQCCTQRSVKMAVSVCRRKVGSGQWIKKDRFYYCSMIGMTYRSIYNASSSRNITSNAGVHIGTMKMNFINERCSLTNKTKCMHRYCVNSFHMEGSYDRKAVQPRNNQTRNPNITGISRWYSHGRGQPREKLPSLMNFPEIVWPSVIKTFRNWILTNILIKPYFDQEFSLPDFILGSKQAVEYVSGCISGGDFAALENLVTQDALIELKRNISTFTLHQRQELALSKEDIYFCFPYEIGIMSTDDEKKEQRFVEITMCYHVLQGLKQLTEQGITPPLNMGILPEYKHKLYICNYRFIREFTKGVEDQWTVNIVNHFRPSGYAS